MEIEQNHFKQMLSGISLTPEATTYLEEIQHNLSQDFVPARGGYYSHEASRAIINLALEKLKLRLATKAQPIDFKVLREEWSAVLVEYHKENNWGFQAQTQKPKKELTEDQKVFRELLPYFGLIIITGFIVKTAFFYYGMHSASNPTSENKDLLIVMTLLLIASTLYFIFKKSK